ncbi:YfiR family protein [Rudaea sp.]|uniref:YfiR family protein n=1 Tax=Rudaea sp. TaxID=2136325 RepID=UPI002ED1473B
MAAALACAATHAVGVEMQADGLSNSAEYIAGFVRYVHWQGEEQLHAWNICIVGNLPAEQDRAYAGRIVRGKPFSVRRIDAEATLADCQVLDLTAVDAATTDKVLARARRLPILAVGSGSGFCSSGGQICLHLDGAAAADRQKFEVNVSAMKEAALGVSARLLTLGSSRTASKGVP